MGHRFVELKVLFDWGTREVSIRAESRESTDVLMANESRVQRALRLVAPEVSGQGWKCSNESAYEIAALVQAFMNRMGCTFGSDVVTFTTTGELVNADHKCSTCGRVHSP